MPKFAMFFSYTPEAWAKLIAKPSDRREAARSMTEALEGSLESIYFMFGERDGFLVIDVPDADAAAAAAVAVAGSGAFAKIQTHQLIEPERLSDVLAKANTAAGKYRPPGS